MTDTKDAWGYVRLSQRGRDGSLEGQKEEIRNYCKRNNLNLQTTRNEGDKTSGFNADREEYQLLRSKICAGDIDAVVVRDRARLSRDFDDRLELLTQLRTNGVELHVTEDRGKANIADVQSAGIECLLAMMDHVKKKIEIERSKAAVAERLENGYYQGKPPYGLEFDEQGQYLTPSEEFQHVLTILELRDEGRSFNSIASEVPVSSSTVSNICDRREMYAEYAVECEVNNG